jgi:hypothetical protein
MRYTHSAVGLKRLSLPLACWELGFVLRVAPLPAFLLLLAGPGPCGVCRVSYQRQSYAVGAQRGRGRGAGRGAGRETRKLSASTLDLLKLPAVR